MRNLLVISLAFSASTLALGQTIWDESVHGDLSGDRLNPNNLQLNAGVNSLFATSVQGDREYVHFHLGGGLSLNQLVLVAWDGNDQIAFAGVQSGSTFTEPPTGTNVANLLGYSHFGPGAGNLGLDFLPAMGTGAGSIGFTPPLMGSDYTFWLQQTGPNPVTYRLDFVVAPEPALLVSMLAGILAVRKKRASDSRSGS